MEARERGKKDAGRKEEGAQMEGNDGIEGDKLVYWHFFFPPAVLQ